ncbi:MAG: methylmalonyl-CoA mutase, partial [Methyloligellaceae bacterium]
LAKTGDERARDVALGKAELTGVSAFPDLGEARVEAEPHPLPDDLDDPAITIEPVPLRRPAEPFERLREASDAYLEAHKQRPGVALVTLGRTTDTAARASYAESFFAAGGIGTVTIDDPQSCDTSVSPIACICASDETYSQEGAASAKALKSRGAQRIYLVGRPGDMRKKLKQAGVDGFIHQGCDIIETLEDAHDVLGLKQR